MNGRCTVDKVQPINWSFFSAKVMAHGRCHYCNDSAKWMIKCKTQWRLICDKHISMIDRIAKELYLHKPIPKLMTECGVCGQEDSLDYIIPQDRNIAAKAFYKYGWRVGTPNGFDFIGFVCPECVKEHGLEKESK